VSEKPRVTWSQRWDDFCRRHPWVLFAIVLLTGFLAGPLMIAASRVTAVLYKDF